ncbi:MAG TPA: DUF2339 domain-containing protein, partial [Candidatus Ozemobacteraceae bacterium]|nr:DUF2339 domain-containing protein [Candidatus Ozemobacteraceae bacterium]
SALTAYWISAQAQVELITLHYLVLFAIPGYHVVLHQIVRRQAREHSMIESASHLSPLLAMGLVGILLYHPATAAAPIPSFLFLVLLNILNGWHTLKSERALPFYHLSGIANFALIWLWSARHLSAEHIPLSFCLFAGFSLYYLILGELGPRFSSAHPDIRIPAACFPLFACTFVFALIDQAPAGMNPVSPLWLLLLLDAFVAFQAVRDDQARPIHFIGGIVSFLLLMKWNQLLLSDITLPWALFFFAVFAISHAAVPVLLQRLRPESSPYLWGHLFPPLMLLLMVFPIIRGMAFSLLFWPVIFLVNIAGLIAAWLMAWVWAGVTFLLISMGLVTLCLHRVTDTGHLAHVLVIEFGFSLLFHVWGMFVWKNRDRLVFHLGGWLKGFAGLLTRIEPAEDQTDSPPDRRDVWESDPLNLAVLPSLSGLLPFVLVIFTLQRLPMPHPGQIFLFCFAISILLLRLCKDAGTDATATIALFSVGLVELAWHQVNFSAANALDAAVWYIGFWLLFLLFPFFFRDRVQQRALPWINAALAGPLQFSFLYLSYLELTGKTLPGILPALMALPYLYGLKCLHACDGFPVPVKNQLLAWFGGTSLFFITLIFPIQFDREWLTIGWALLGASLVWLYQRVPHEGLKHWGIGLLLISFARLADPAVFSYCPRQPTPLINWFLYTFSVTGASLITGATLLRPPHHEWFGVNIRRILYILGAVLFFFLLNIEIADFYSTGTTIVFQFSGEALERNTAYSVGWSIFAFILLLVGIACNSRGARLGSIGLLTVTIFKVFLLDLWSLGGLYRVGSLVGLAGALIMVSFLYQKFVTVRAPVSREPESPH